MNHKIPAGGPKCSRRDFFNDRYSNTAMVTLIGSKSCE